MPKEPLFSLTAKDCRVDTFRSGGPGGQNQNKRETGIRITHLASGAVGEGRDERSQGQNKRSAFRWLVESRVFQNWLKVEAATAMMSGEERRVVASQVDQWMQPEKLKVEYPGIHDWIIAILDQRVSAWTHSNLTVAAKHACPSGQCCVSRN